MRQLRYLQMAGIWEIDMRGFDKPSGMRAMIVSLVAMLIVAVVVSDIMVGARRLMNTVQALVPREVPLVIAHRGDSRDPENSLQAIYNTGVIGADYAEIDVRLTADGVPVVFHDRKTGRLDAGGHNVLVSRTPLGRLQRMRMRQKGIDYRIPTLRQALAEAHNAPGKPGLLLDIKTDDRHAHRVARAVIDDIERGQRPDRLMVMSASREAVVFFKRLRPQWKIGLCASGKPTLTGWGTEKAALIERGMRERRGERRSRQHDGFDGSDSSDGFDGDGNNVDIGSDVSDAISSMPSIISAPSSEHLNVGAIDATGATGKVGGSAARAGGAVGASGAAMVGSTATVGSTARVNAIGEATTAERAGNASRLDRHDHYGEAGSTTLPVDFVVMQSRDITTSLWRVAKKRHIPIYVGAVNDYREARMWSRRGASGFLGEDVENLRRAADRYRYILA